MLDLTEQRIIGVLMEKELSVPDSYPMTEHALLAGCNQKSNRDPELALESFQLSGAMMALQEKGWSVRTERDGGRAVRYRHCLEDKLEVDGREKAVLAELLLRGPQSPGALRPRVARMGLEVTAGQIREILEALGGRPRSLVEQLPRQPRERDHRWAHRLGFDAGVDQPADPDPAPAIETEPNAGARAIRKEVVPAIIQLDPGVGPGARTLQRMDQRIGDLERELEKLREEVSRLASALRESDL